MVITGPSDLSKDLTLSRVEKVTGLHLVTLSLVILLRIVRILRIVTLSLVRIVRIL